MLRFLERRILRIVHGPINDNGIWRTRCNNKLYTVCGALDVVKVIKIGKLRWLGYFCRMQELQPCRKLTALKAEDTGTCRKTLAEVA